jgi:hypothetical protein
MHDLYLGWRDSKIPWLKGLILYLTGGVAAATLASVAWHLLVGWRVLPNVAWIWLTGWICGALQYLAMVCALALDRRQRRSEG